MIIGIYICTGVLVPGYFSLGSLRSLLLLSALLGIASVGQTLTVLLGGIDLSIPAVMGFADVAITQLYGDGWPFAAALILVLLAAVALGALNGLLTQSMEVHPLIVTLATGSVLLGGILAYTRGQAGGSVPDWLGETVSVIGHFGPIPLPGVVVGWIGVTALLVLLQRGSLLGRMIYAVGANPAAARLARLPTLRVWMATYAISAGFSAAAGVLLAGFSGAADPAVGEPYLFMTVAAVVVGGTPLTGGQGGYLRTVAGCLIITELTTLLIGFGLEQSGQQIFLGLLIVALAGVSGRLAHVRMRL